MEALPALLYRIAQTLTCHVDLRVNPPLRVKSGSFLHDAEYLRKQVALAAAKAAQMDGAVLVLLDCEDDCPAVLGPRLLQDAQTVRSDIGMLVTLAYREYETWFLTAVRSLRGLRGLPEDIDPPQSPEAIRDAKGWLGSRMESSYDPVIHQLEFTRKFDMDQARDNPSFDRFYRKICEFLQTS